MGIHLLTIRILHLMSLTIFNQSDYQWNMVDNNILNRVERDPGLILGS